MAKKIYTETGITFTTSFFVLFIANSVVVSLANTFFPESIVLGTASITPNWALFHAVGTLSVLNVLLIPLIHEYENAREKMFTSKEWTAAYFAINFVGLWTISRFAEQLGMGIASWRVVLVLVLVLDIVQGMAMMAVEKVRTKK